MADFDNRLSERGSLMEPIIWLGVLAVLLVIEGLTTALTTIWFAGGALAAAIAAGIGMGIVPQLLLFFCVSLVLLFFTRPAALKLMRKDTEKTNVEGLLGKKAVVIQKINNLAQTGQVRINDIEWMARTSDDSVTIPVDTVVIIKAVHGVKLIVEPKEAEYGKYLIFADCHDSGAVDPGILHPHRTPGICDRT